jgi:hypothetical protein
MSNSNGIFNLFSGQSNRGASSSQILEMIHEYNNNMRRMIYLLETTETRVSTNRRNSLFTVDATSILSSFLDASGSSILSSFFDSPTRGGMSNDEIDTETTLSLYEPMSDASNNPVSDTCPITMETFQAGDSVLRINHCGHVFKEGALRTWLARDGRCPVCRGSVIAS